MVIEALAKLKRHLLNFQSFLLFILGIHLKNRAPQQNTWFAFTWVKMPIMTNDVCQRGWHQQQDNLGIPIASECRVQGALPMVDSNFVAPIAPKQGCNHL